MTEHICHLGFSSTSIALTSIQIIFPCLERLCTVVAVIYILLGFLYILLYMCFISYHFDLS